MILFCVTVEKGDGGGLEEGIGVSGVSDTKKICIEAVTTEMEV